MSSTKRSVRHEGNIRRGNARGVGKHVLDGKAMLGIGPILVHREEEKSVVDAQRQVRLENSKENKKDMEAKETEDAGFHWTADSSN